MFIQKVVCCLDPWFLFNTNTEESDAIESFGPASIKIQQHTVFRIR